MKLKQLSYKRASLPSLLCPMEELKGLRARSFCINLANGVPLSFSYSYDPVSPFLNYIDNGNFSVNDVLADMLIAPHIADCFAHLGQNASAEGGSDVQNHLQLFAQDIAEVKEFLKQKGVSIVVNNNAWVFFLSLLGITPLAERLGYAAQ
ncbi:protein suppressor of npr1-1 constitutive 4 [Quercus suber]|uniref:Protein suppressor of npr1-1 constitutive 4 n=1 Tax=Quercus suber TaxID=58331 RepID=A0AAW0IKK5_QUESU